MTLQELWDKFKDTPDMQILMPNMDDNGIAYSCYVAFDAEDIEIKKVGIIEEYLGFKTFWDAEDSWFKERFSGIATYENAIILIEQR